MAGSANPPESTDRPWIRVEVAYALPQRQVIIALDVRRGCSAREAIELSAIGKQFPDLDLASLALGIFSRPLNGTDLPLPEAYELEAGDRVEIYRPLHKDPKQARLDRARKNKTVK